MDKEKILIADDEAYLRKSIEFVLNKRGYIILVAANGEEALNIVKKERPDLILLDIMMPKMNGYQVCRLIKDDPETNGTYVIMLTAKGQEIDKILGSEAGVDEYITKPFSPRKLVARIDEVLEKRFQKFQKLPRFQELNTDSTDGNFGNL